MTTIQRFWNTYFDFHYPAACGIGTGLFAACCIILYRLQKGGKKRGWTAGIAWAFLFSVYMVFLLGVTLLNRHMEESYNLELQLFWSYQKALENHSFAMAQQILFNILAFMPFGILFPMTFKPMGRFFRTAGCGMLLSAFIELTQLFFRCGLCELDDVMNNTLGAVTGYLIFAAVRKIHRVCRRSLHLKAGQELEYP